MSPRLRPPGLRRRRSLLATLAWLGLPAGAADNALREAMRRAEALRDEAVRAGDQPFGAVVLRGGVVVGAAPSRVVTATDPTAHADTTLIKIRFLELLDRRFLDGIIAGEARLSLVIDSIFYGFLFLCFSFIYKI